MCVAIPGRVTKISGDLAEVDMGGVIREVNIQFTPEAKKDDYLLIHAGFAINIISVEEAEETLRLLTSLDVRGES